MTWHNLDDIRAGVEVSDFVPAKTTAWEFPRDRFIEYGPEDEWWARKLGFGRPVRRACAYQVATTFFVHPDVYAHLVAALKPRRSA